jgi:pimeloyl-ACP methyl ester carboxylesterase
MPPADDWRSLYPFDSHLVALDGRRMHFLDEGVGAPLLMVHGNPTWSFYWRNLVLAFRDRYRVVVPDHIGCGMSDKPVRGPYTLERHIAHLIRLVQYLDLQDVTLFCHDWGGPIGLGTAIELPTRFSRLVIFNTGAFPPPYVPWRIRACRTPLLGRWVVQGLNGFARAALRMATEKPERLTPDIRAGLLAPYGSWAQRTAIYRFVADIPVTRSHPTHATLAAIEDELPTLADRPCQLIWGMKDWCFRPECLERLAAILPNAEIHRFHDAGHYVIEDAHERIVPVVTDFLNRTDTVQ